jgi:DNA polymerase-3 subunit epsilon
LFDFIKDILNIRSRKLPANASRPLSELRFVVVDTELTGLDTKRDSIVSIGAVRMRGGVIDLGDTFYQLVNPEKPLSASSVVIHEITPSEVAEKPPIDTVLTEFLEFAADDILVGHFISIDLAFLNREKKRMFDHELDNAAIDTLSIYEWISKRAKPGVCVHAPIKGYRLYDIAKCFDVPLNVAHNAIADAYMTAQLLQRFLPILKETGVRTLEDLLGIGSPFKGTERFGADGELSNL